MSELISKYDPKITIINNKNSAKLFEPMNQLETNEVNIYSSMISRSLPSILNNCGLIDFAFHYVSDISSIENTNQISLNPFDEKKSAWKINNYSTLAPLSGGEAKMRVQAAMKMIEEYIFNPIVLSVGNIDVDVSAYSTDDTYVKLRLLDRDSSFNYIDDPYIEHSCLGGINTPLVGDSNIIFENGTNLMSLTKSILSENDIEAF
jgi:CRISPR/Cas system CMR-associated protein Cmr5 small subunit